MNGRIAKQIRSVFEDPQQYKRVKRSYTRANKFQRAKAITQITHVLSLKKTGTKLNTLHIEED